VSRRFLIVKSSKRSHPYSLDFASAGDPGATDNSRKEQGAGSVGWEHGHIYIGPIPVACMYEFLKIRTLISLTTERSYLLTVGKNKHVSDMLP
ncbi:hypothetical protein Tco_1452173, partial [Tanacetum coccineum]